MSAPSHVLESTKLPRNYIAHPTTIGQLQKGCHSNSSYTDSNEKTLLIFVHTARKNFERRGLIRQTWGPIKSYQGWTISGPLFMIGDAPDEEDDEIKIRLDVENYLHNDFVHLGVVDTYHNITRKALLAYNWVTRYCPHVKIVVKTDDDVVVNIFQLVKELEKMQGTGTLRQSYYCFVAKGVHPERDPYKYGGKYTLTYEQFPDELYPPFCIGLGWVSTVMVLRKVLQAFSSYNDTIIRMDDVFLSGILSNRFNLQVKKYSLSSQTSKEVDEWDRRISFQVKNSEWFYCPYCPPEGASNYRDFLLWQSSLDTQNKTSYLDTKIFYLVEGGPTYVQEFLTTWNKIRQLHQL